MNAPPYPEALRGRWKQLLRWSMGGSQVLIDYTPQLKCLLDSRQ
jgi:hypothetical protein